MDRAPGIAAHASQLTPESLIEARVDVAEDSETYRVADAPGSLWLAADPVVCCGRSQPTAEDGQANRPGNCRDVKRFEMGTRADPAMVGRNHSRLTPALGRYSRSNGLRT